MASIAVGSLAGILVAHAAIASRHLPFRAADRLVALGASYEGGPFQRGLTYGQWERIRTHEGAFTGVAAVQDGRFLPAGRFDLKTAGHALRLRGARVSLAYFQVIGVGAVLGRVFDGAQDEDRNAAVISHRLWRAEFGGTPAVLGTTITLGNAPFVVVGVTGPDFSGTDAEPTDVWIPWEFTHEETKVRGQVCCLALGRMNDGRTVSDVSDLLSIGLRNQRLVAKPLRDYLMLDAVDAIRMLRVAVILVFALCAIVLTHDAVSQAVAESHDLSVLRQLGAPASAAAHLLAADAILLTTASILPTLLVSAVTAETLEPVLGPIDLAALLACSIAALVATCAGSGTISALWLVAGRRRMAGRLSRVRSTRTAGLGRLRRGLSFVVASILVAVLVLATIVTSNALQTTRPNLGFEPSGLLMVDVRLDALQYASAAALARFETNAAAALGTLPGVQQVSVGSAIPVAAPGRTRVISGGDLPGRVQFTEYRVRHDMLALLGIKVVEGRPFIPKEDEAVALVSATCARRLAGQASSLGRVLPLSVPTRVVGVTADLTSRLANWDDCAVFVPDNQERTGLVRFALKVGAARPSDRLLRDAIHAVAPGQAVDRIVDVERYIDEQLAPRHLIAAVLAALSVVCWIVAFVWFQQATTIALVERRAEIGTRLALGANPSALARTVIRQELGLLVAGVFCGAAASVPLVSVTRYLIYDVSTSEWGRALLFTLIGVTLVGSVCRLAVTRIIRTPPHELLRTSH
jgi:hypothetical protein